VNTDGRAWIILAQITMKKGVKAMQGVEIIIKGQIDPLWSEWLGGLEIAHIGQDHSQLSGSIADQATLYGILTKLRDLDLNLVSVELTEGVHHE
jgi:hypothetical protein